MRYVPPRGRRRVSIEYHYPQRLGEKPPLLCVRQVCKEEAGEGGENIEACEAESPVLKCRDGPDPLDPVYDLQTAVWAVRQEEKGNRELQEDGLDQQALVPLIPGLPVIVRRENELPLVHFRQQRAHGVVLGVVIVEMAVETGLQICIFLLLHGEGGALCGVVHGGPPDPRCARACCGMRHPL